MRRLNVIGLDPGCKNLGYTCSYWTKNRYGFWDINVTSFERVDLTSLICRKESDLEACTLWHRPHCLADCLKHLFVKVPAFKECDHIIAEYQHPGSAMVPVQELFQHYFGPEKYIMYSPSTVQKHYGYADLSYEGRKEFVVKRMIKLLKCDIDQVRKHDIADSFTFLNYHADKENARIEKQMERGSKHFKKFKEWQYDAKKL